MESVTAFLDASVLYPAPLRDILLELAVSDVYRAKWSNIVHEEWMSALLRSRGDLTRERLERTRDHMNAHVRESVVTDFEDLIDALTLPDPNDRHVLAAAIKGQATVIVTSNLRDFPTIVLKRWNIEAKRPDDLLKRLFEVRQSGFLQAVATVRKRLRNPPKSPEEYLDTLRAQGLNATAGLIAPFAVAI